MPKYILTSPTFEGSILISYNDNGLLSKLEFNCPSFTPANIAYMLKNVPINNQHIYDMTKGTKASIALANDDLSFNSFWSKYAYKVGHKARAEKLWKLLSNEDKILALAYIHTYNNFLIDHPKQDRQYPETYLAQRRWNN